MCKNHTHNRVPKSKYDISHYSLGLKSLVCQQEPMMTAYPQVSPRLNY
jgi:hypothetical protein